jgi:hypothetical protein
MQFLLGFIPLFFISCSIPSQSHPASTSNLIEDGNPQYSIKTGSNKKHNVRSKRNRKRNNNCIRMGPASMADSKPVVQSPLLSMDFFDEMNAPWWLNNKKEEEEWKREQGIFITGRKPSPFHTPELDKEWTETIVAKYEKISLLRKPTWSKFRSYPNIVKLFLSYFLTDTQLETIEKVFIINEEVFQTLNAGKRLITEGEMILKKGELLGLFQAALDQHLTEWLDNKRNPRMISQAVLDFISALWNIRFDFDYSIYFSLGSKSQKNLYRLSLLLGLEDNNVTFPISNKAVFLRKLFNNLRGVILYEMNANRQGGHQVLCLKIAKMCSMMKREDFANNFTLLGNFKTAIEIQNFRAKHRPRYSEFIRQSVVEPYPLLNPLSDNNQYWMIPDQVWIQDSEQMIPNPYNQFDPNRIWGPQIYPEDPQLVPQENYYPPQ